MVSSEISKRVLLVGPDYREPKGGIAAVLNAYNSLFETFKFLATSPKSSDSLLVKQIVAAKAILKLPFILLFDKDIRIIHVHSSSRGSFKRKRIVIKIAKFFDKKVIFHCHSGHFRDYRLSHKAKVDETLGQSDMIVGLSKEWKEYFEGLGYSNVVAINNVMASPVYRCINKDNRMHILFLGLIGENKGIYDVLNVLIEHHDELKEHLVLHIGGNGETDKLQEIISTNRIEDIVSFEGWVDKEKKVNLYNQADALILTSYYEGVPITLLEAMSYKKAVITTPVGGIPSIVKDKFNGLLVEPGNKDQIWNALSYALQNREKLTEMGMNGYEISKDYLPETISKQLTDLYLSLC